MPDDITEQKPPPMCSKCGAEPAAPGQRWGRKCRAESAKKRRKETVRVPREFVVRGTLDANGRVRAAALLKARKRTRKGKKPAGKTAPVNGWATKREWERIDAHD